MTRPFWTRPKQPEPDTCESLELLLSPYADGMAAPEEALRVDHHLPSCPACRQSLLWMQATRKALASRPLVLPPPDLRARIARSIAEIDAAPSVQRPARVFTLRPAYAAAASLSVVAAVVGYGLMHAQTPAHVAPVRPVQVAKATKTVLTAPTKATAATAPKPTVKAAPTHLLVAQANPHHSTERIASKGPDDQPEVPARDTVPAAPPTHASAPSPNPEPVLDTPIHTIHIRPRALPHVKPISPRSPVAVMAFGKLPHKPVEGKAPNADLPEARHTDPQVASDKVPDVRVPIQVERPVVTNDTPPVVRTASASFGVMGSVQAYIHVHQTGYEHELSLAGRTAVRTATRTATSHPIAITSGPEGQEVYQDMIH